MIRFFDISAWEVQEYFNTGGTRNKEVVENPENGKLYYFKTSLKKEMKDYTYEFWSEIIASQLGEILDFDILHYDVAINKGQLGCLSESMITPVEELQEGYKWLIGYTSEYDTEDKEAYTFQIIEEMFKKNFPNKDFFNKLIETVIFDSVIGNEDRHQENWSIIISKEKREKKKLFKKIQIVEEQFKFAPIYDSGSSLGRELKDDKIKQMLNDSNQLQAYINRGKSEIHWRGEKGKQNILI